MRGSIVHREGAEFAQRGVHEGVQSVHRRMKGVLGGVYMVGI